MIKGTRGLLTIFACACLMSLFGTIAAFADTQSGNQNPDLRLIVTVASSGSNPQMATVGDVVTTTWTVQNTTSRALRVKIVYVIAPPRQAVRNVTRKLTIPAHAAYTNSESTVIVNYMCPGTFYASFKTTDDLGPGFKSFSSARATVTDYN